MTGNLPQDEINFQGTIAHELAHVAVGEHLVLLNNYVTESSKHNDYPEPIGQAYNYNQPGMTAMKETEEKLAMTVAAYMYEPNALGAGTGTNKFLSWLTGCYYAGTNWRYVWVERQADILNGNVGLYPSPTDR